MRGWRLWLLVGVALVVVVVIAAIIALPRLVDTPRMQALIAQNASQALGRPVTFSGLSVSVLPRPSVVLRQLEVAEDPAFGQDPFLKLDRAEVQLRLWPLLSARVELGEFLLKSPDIALVQAADGRWNVASLGPASEAHGAGRPRPSGSGATPAALVGSRIRIEDGRLRYEARAGKDARYAVERLNLTLSSGLGPVAFEGDALVTPGGLAVRIRSGSVGLGGAKSVLEAPVTAQVSIESTEIRELVARTVGPEPGIAGSLKGDLALAGTVEKPRATGDVELTRLAVTRTNPECPEPKRRTLELGRLTLAAAWEDARLTAAPVKAALGAGTISTNLGATVDGGTAVELTDIAIKGVPVEKVLVDFLCQGYAVMGPLDLAGKAAARLDDLWNTLNGAGVLKIGPGKVVGQKALALMGGVVRVGGAISSLLSADLPSSVFTSPLEFESITGTYTITGGVVATEDLTYTSRAMNVAVAGTYALATGAMNLDVLVKTGRGEIKAKVTGTAASPSIRVAPRTVIREVDPGKIERGLRDLLKRFQ